MNKSIFFISLFMAIVLSGCSKKSTVDAVGEISNAQSNKVVRKVLRSHLVYRMNGDYANLVPVTLDEKGNLRSYPDPIDVSESVKPIALGDGWYLDRRGISVNTVFMDYTYEEYHALPLVPSVDTLMEHIKVRNAITAIWNCGTEQRTVEEYKALVKEGFPGCEQIK